MGLGAWIIISLVINWIGFTISWLLRTEKFYDLFGTSTFVLLTLGTLLQHGPLNERKLLLSFLVFIWALRLGYYLVNRVMQTGRDSRFDEAKNDIHKFFFLWTGQGVWAFVTASPVLLVNILTVSPPWRWTDWLGVALWAMGLLIEATADYQKAQFRCDPANKGKFINQGLWSYSRHPNYFGEVMLWCGITIASSAVFSAWYHYLTIFSPVFVYLLVRHASGVPLQEKQAQQRWGHTAEYQEYLRNTNMLVPLPKIRKLAS